MKTTIVKNDNFETIGLEVRSAQKLLFSWGVSPSSPIYWVKEIDANKYIQDIFELVRIEVKIREAKQFVGDFFEVAKINELLKDNQPVRFEENKARIERLENKMLSIIQSIK